MKKIPRFSRRILTSGAIGGAAIAALGVGVPVTAHSMQSSQPSWQPGDTLRLAGSTYGPAGLDPALSRDLSTNFLLRQIFRGLLSLDGDLIPGPELAEATDISADGLLHTFGLREGVTFHDGTPITPDHVRMSLSRALNPGITAEGVDGLAAITYLRDIAGAETVISGEESILSGIEIVGDNSLTIALTRPSPTFLMKLASVPASIVDTSQADADAEWWRTPNGSGPYVLSVWRPDDLIELSAFNGWWGGKANVSTVSIRIGASASQPVNLFQAGELDILDDLTPTLVTLVEDPATGVDYGEMVSTNLFSTFYIALGNQVAPLDDEHIRRALQAIFPARQVAEATYDGEVATAEGLLPPGMLGREWNVELPAEGIDVARAEIRKSRYGNAESVPPIPIYGADVFAIEGLRDIANRELGLRVEAIQVPWSLFMPGLGQRQFPAYALYWGADYPDPESMIDMLFGATSADNYTGYENQELESLLEQARVTDGEERADILSQANQLLVDDAAVIPLYHQVGFTLVREGLSGLTVTPMGILGLESLR